MRTPAQVRVMSFLAFALAVAVGLVVSFVIHAVFGGVGRFGFEDFNFGGLLEGLGFAFTLALMLLLVRNAAHLPVTTLLSCGLVAPPTAQSAAAPVAVVDHPSTLEVDDGVAVWLQGGKPAGVLGGRRDRAVAWDDVAQVSGLVAVTELRGLLSKNPFVMVVDGPQVHGVITQEMYLAGLWSGRSRP